MGIVDIITEKIIQSFGVPAEMLGGSRWTIPVGSLKKGTRFWHCGSKYCSVRLIENGLVVAQHLANGHLVNLAKDQLVEIELARPPQPPEPAQPRLETRTRHFIPEFKILPPEDEPPPPPSNEQPPPDGPEEPAEDEPEPNQPEPQQGEGQPGNYVPGGSRDLFIVEHVCDGFVGRVTLEDPNGHVIADKRDGIVAFDSAVARATEKYGRAPVTVTKKISPPS